MKHTFQDFKKILMEGITPLSYEDFLKTERIGKLWDKFDEDDIRVKHLKTKENFYDWCYNIINDDNILERFFNRRLKYSPLKPVEILLIKDKELLNKINNSGFLRNINLKAILDTEEAGGASLKNSFKNAHEKGIMDRAFTMPSTFESTITGWYDPLIVTLKTTTGIPSIFSPSVYRALVLETDKYLKGKQKLLLCTASWASPIIALQNFKHYTDVHIVDVQQPVLDTCEKLFDHLNDNDFFDAPYELKTFCTPSEKMTSVVDDNYDKIFFCPPYYDLELYGNSDEQSTDLYDTYEKWLDGYWRGTVNAGHKVLNKDGIFSFVIGYNIRGYDMAEDMLKICEEKFTLLDTIKIKPIAEPTKEANKQEKYELCYILRKNN